MSLEKKEWMAFHDDIHFNNFRTLSFAVEYYKNALYRGWNKSSKNTINMEFYYPIVVVQGELLEVQPSETGVNIQATDHIQYRQTSIVNSKDVNYQIDVVTEHFLPNLLSIIDSELEKTIYLLSKEQAIVSTAINKIIELAKRAKNQNELRAAFDLHLISQP